MLSSTVHVKIFNALEYEFDRETSCGSWLLMRNYYTVIENLFQKESSR